MFCHADIPIIDVSPQYFNKLTLSFKRAFDVVFSLAVLTVLSPLFIIIAVLIKLSSPGPIFFKHTAIGKDGKPFMFYKFRSMYLDAEKNGPALPSVPGITRASGRAGPFLVRDPRGLGWRPVWCRLPFRRLWPFKKNV